MKFIVLLKGRGTGCDYTIGCNKTWREFDAQNLEEAKAKVKEIILEYSEPDIAEARLMAHAYEDIDARAVYQEQEEKRKRKKEEQDKKKRKKEYEKLKAEFDNKG